MNVQQSTQRLSRVSKNTGKTRQSVLTCFPVTRTVGGKRSKQGLREEERRINHNKKHHDASIAAVSSDSVPL